MANPTLKEISKQNYDAPSGLQTYESINTGCLQRIADATEHMASNYVQMQRDLKWYKRRVKEQSEYQDKMHRKIAALKGVITKLKKSQNP